MITVFLEYLTVLLIILECSTIYAAAIDTDYHLPEVTAFTASVLLLFEVSTFRFSKRAVNRLGLWLFFYYLLMLLFMLLSVNIKIAFTFVVKFLIILPILVFIFTVHTQQHKPYRLLYRYSDVMLVIALISLFFWVFASLLHLIPPSSYFRASWGMDYAYPCYWGLYAERQINFGIYRNESFFCEGPMYSLCLVFALAIELFLQPADGVKKRNTTKQSDRSNIKRRKARVTILIITLLSTLTTTGTIVLIAMLSMRFFLIRANRQETYSLKLIASVIVFGIAVIAMLYVFESKALSHSWRARTDDFVSGFNAWLENPLFGSGFGDSSLIQAYMNKNIRSNLGFSNSASLVLAQGGIVLFLVYMIPIAGTIIQSFNMKSYNIAAFSFVILVEFTFTIWSYRFLMLFLLAFLYGQIFMRYSSVYAIGKQIQTAINTHAQKIGSDY